MIPGHKKKKSRVYSILNFFVTLIIIFLVWLYFNLSDIKKLFQAMEQLEKEKNEVYVLEKTNERLKEEIRRLQDDPEYIEQIAREQHKLKKHDEERLIVKEKDESEDK